MKIAVLHRCDVEDVDALSGYAHFMLAALRRLGAEVVPLGPDRSWPTQALELAGRAANQLLWSGLRRRISSDHHRLLARRLAHVFQPRLDACGCEVLFAPNAAVELAYLTPALPVVYASDLTWHNIVDYYPKCRALLPAARREAESIEAAGMSRAAALVFPSAWAARTAVAHYGIEAQRVHCVPYGANFAAADLPSRAVALQHRLEGPLRLLWIGVDWERKGGRLAYDCLLALLERGVSARLTVCGCQPPSRYRHSCLTVIPFLSKHTKEGRARLSQLLLDSHFFLFPTQAEAFGIVLCEASAHGLPSLACDTGGVGGAIGDGENGFLLPLHARGVDYADKLAAIARSPEQYRRLVRSSRDAYEQRLNWNEWGRAMQTVFAQVLTGRA